MAVCRIYMHPVALNVLLRVLDIDRRALCAHSSCRAPRGLDDGTFLQSLQPTQNNDGGSLEMEPHDKN